MLVIAFAVSAAAQGTGYSDNDAQAKAPIPYKNLPGPGKAGITYKIVDDSEDSFAPALRGMDFEKSEFETKAQYIARIRDWSSKTKFADGRSISSAVLVFGDDVSTYDAEDKVMMVSPRVQFITLTRRREHPRVRFVKFNSHGGRFEPQNSVPTLTFDLLPEVAKMIKSKVSYAIYGTPIGHIEEGKPLMFLPSKAVVFNRDTFEIYSIKDLDDWQY